MFSKCAEEEADKQKQYRFQNTTLRHTVSKRSERGPEIRSCYIKASFIKGVTYKANPRYLHKVFYLHKVSDRSTVYSSKVQYSSNITFSFTVNLGLLPSLVHLWFYF